MDFVYSDSIRDRLQKLYFRGNFPFILKEIQRPSGLLTHVHVRIASKKIPYFDICSIIIDFSARKDNELKVIEKASRFADLLLEKDLTNLAILKLSNIIITENLGSTIRRSRLDLLDITDCQNVEHIFSNSSRCSPERIRLKLSEASFKDTPPRLALNSNLVVVSIYFSGSFSQKSLTIDMSSCYQLVTM